MWRNRTLNFTKVNFVKIALLIVAAAFLLYNIYQAIITTIFVSHFPTIISQLPNFITSSQPSLQVGLFLLQEVAASAGSYLRLIGGIFAFNCAFLFFKKDPKYLVNLGRALLFESLYFLLLIPAGVNHVVGSTISSSAFLNIYTGISFLIQAVLIFPSLFLLSRKLGKPRDFPSITKWALMVAPLYVLGFWVKHGLMWIYAISPAGNPQTGLVEAVGLANSLFTLLVATIVTAGASSSFRQNKSANKRLIGSALILIGVYFAVYTLVSVWVPVYWAFLPLTEFWMITVLILGAAVLLVPKQAPSEQRAS
jgi:hypothetical protein